MKELPKVYEPQQVEGRIYQMWMDHDCFKAEPDPRGLVMCKVVSSLQI